MTLLVAGKGSGAAAKAAAAVAGVSRVLHLDDAGVDHGVAEQVAEAVLAAQAKHSACGAAE